VADGRFAITDLSIDAQTSGGPAAGFPEAGAVATFEGRVRNHHGGREVLALEYEAHAPLACSEGDRILEEAISRFRLQEARAVHRVGRLEIGEVAVRITAVAAHRREAFAACRWMLDEIKRRLPIWKKEFYSEGDADWVNCQCLTTSASEAEYYHRQAKLREVGEEGQARLKAASVLVVGAGGLGCAALPYLAAAGVGRIGIVEDDEVEVSNLHRQTLYSLDDAGGSKIEAAARRLRALNPYIEVEEHPFRIAPSSAAWLMRGYDVVLDGTDNFRAKFLINDACVAEGKPLVQASLYQFEGQIHLYVPGGPCLRCLWKEAPQDGCVGTCGEVGVLGAVAGVLGTLQASETLKLILGLPSTLGGEMVLVDLLSLGMTRIRRERDPDCSCCGAGRPLVDEDLSLIPDSLDGFVVVDLREPDEGPRPLRVPNLLEVACEDLQQALATLDPSRRYLLVCTRGVRSLAGARLLRQHGFARAYSLDGGVNALWRLRGGTEPARG
jgi:sulfur-carrier protein adenylyltransferase/sulfurtransferase